MILLRSRGGQRGASALSVFLVIAIAGCAGAPAPSPVASIAERGGIRLNTELSGTVDSLVVESRVANERTEPVYLVPDQCGRVTEALLARTAFQPEGKAWTGSVRTLKALILEDQAFQERPDLFHPRRPGDPSSRVPDCERPERLVELGPDASISERWELPLRSSMALDAVGSANTVVRVEVVEARDPGRLEFLDIRFPGGSDDERAGRNVRVEVPASQVIDRPALPHDGMPSLGELFDRLLEHDGLRAWIEAQPEDGWREADLNPDGPELSFVANTTAFERALRVTGKPDATAVTVDQPTEADRTRVFERRPATLPPGVALIEEPEAGVPSADILPGTVWLPSGRVVVGEYLLDAEPLPIEVAPRAYPAHATLVRYPGSDFESVALLTLVVSDEATTRWVDAGGIAVDGGTASITSPEAVDTMRETFDRDEDAWWRDSEAIWDSLAAHDQLVTEADVDGAANLVMSTSGFGDGGYPVYIGFDAAGEPTRVVIDFVLLHLDWPVPTTE